jgi:glyoxylase-like metal-dependent hydrolase (beta-lactamase superfamily II)
MRRFARWFALTAAIASLGAASGLRAPEYEVYAIRYATIPGFKVSGLISGADTSRRLDIAMMVWLIKGSDGRTIVMDAGFKRQDLIDRWKPANYVTPAAALERFGVKPEAVTDVIISHVHWDHLDGADLFPNAKIWIQKEEYEHHVDSTGKRLAGAIDTADATMLHRMKLAGRVNLVDGDAREIIPGITVYIGGKHTFQSQFAGVNTSSGIVVLASDNMYLYENLEKHVPISQTLDAASNLAAQERMTHIAANVRLIVPGHDPAVFERFPAPGAGVARIR